MIDFSTVCYKDIVNVNADIVTKLYRSLAVFWKQCYDLSVPPNLGVQGSERLILIGRGRPLQNEAFLPALIISLSFIIIYK